MATKYPRKKIEFKALKDNTDLYAPTKVSRRKVVFETSEEVLRVYAAQLPESVQVLFLLERGLEP